FRRGKTLAVVLDVFCSASIDEISEHVGQAKLSSPDGALQRRSQKKCVRCGKGRQGACDLRKRTSRGTRVGEVAEQLAELFGKVVGGSLTPVSLPSEGDSRTRARRPAHAKIDTPRVHTGEHAER